MSGVPKGNLVDARTMFLATKFYVIPDEQCQFRWSDLEIVRLLDNIYQCYSDGKFLFIGFFILYEMKGGIFDVSSNMKVYDGQQRIVTLFLFLSIAHVYLKDGDYIDNLKEKIISKRDTALAIESDKTRVTRDKDPWLNKYFEFIAQTPEECVTETRNTVENIKKNDGKYEEFNKYKEFLEGIVTIDDWCKIHFEEKDFRNLALLHHLNAMFIMSDDSDFAVDLFLSLNHYGKQLTLWDTLRFHLLKKVESEGINTVEEFEGYFSDEYDKLLVVTCVFVSRRLRKKTQRSWNIDPQILLTELKLDDSNTLLSELISMSKIFKDMKEGNYTDQNANFLCEMLFLDYYSNRRDFYESSNISKDVLFATMIFAYNRRFQVAFKEEDVQIIIRKTISTFLRDCLEGLPQNFVSRQLLQRTRGETVKEFKIFKYNVNMKGKYFENPLVKQYLSCIYWGEGFNMKFRDMEVCRLVPKEATGSDYLRLNYHYTIQHNQAKKVCDMLGNLYLSDSHVGERIPFEQKEFGNFLIQPNHGENMFDYILRGMNYCLKYCWMY